MHTYKDLAKLGRLGNQLFQIAATIGTAVSRNDLYVFPQWPYQNKLAVPIMDTKYFSDIKWHEEFEGGFTYNPAFNMLASHQNNVTLMGYFQSEKYFKHCKDIIINSILHEKSIERRTQILLENPLLDSDTCCLHIRRGDYTHMLDYYIDLASTPYYYLAIAHMQKLGVKRFIVFSDDMAWCKATLPAKHQGIDLIFSNCTVDFDDLILMSACNYHIMANSSFSWWGSYIANSKQVIAPKAWFGQKITSSTKDLYRDEMIQI